MHRKLTTLRKILPLSSWDQACPSYVQVGGLSGESLCPHGGQSYLDVEDFMITA